MTPATPAPSWRHSARLAALGLGESRLALGLAGLGGAWGAIDEGKSLETILGALAEGVTAFDAAPSYLAAERLLGRALTQWRGARPVVSTKVGRPAGIDAFDERFDYSSAAMRESLRTSLATLGLDAVDLLFLHEPDYVPPAERPRVIDCLRQMQADGLARRLGLGGGRGADWSFFVESGVFDVAMGFNRLNALNLAALSEDFPALRQRGMTYYAASPLAMGVLGASQVRWRAALPPWLPPDTWARVALLQQLAEAHGLTLPALAHRFLFGAAEADRVVLGAGNASEFSDALAAWRTGPLEPELQAAVRAIAS